MKKIITILSFIFSTTLIYSQEIPIDLLDRINQVEYIFEGVVLESKSYYSNNSRYIRTSNLVEVTKVLKGNLTCGTVEIITNGGKLNDKELSISHSLELYKNNIGIFLCDLTNRPLSLVDFHSETNFEKLEGKFENQSFIQYWWDGEKVNASDIWLNYDSLAVIYDVMEQVSGYNFIDCGNQTEPLINSYFPMKSSNSISSSNATNDTILSYYPETLAGGINDTLTIIGSGFDASKGYILLPNADNGGSSKIILEDEYIAVWNDSTIKFVIPSYAETFSSPILYGKPVGTGVFEIHKTFGELILQDTFVVEYSVRNHNDQFPNVVSPWQEMNKKFVFRCDTAVSNYDNGNMKTTIEKALDDWKCLTGIDWELGADTAYLDSLSLQDKVCTIIFRDYPDSSSTLAATSVRTSKVTTSSMDSSYQIYETDITINSDKDWFCDTISTNTVPTGKKDFYAVILHELGHAHGLKHVININAVMHYTVNISQRIINLSNDLSCDKGGNWMANHTNDINNQIFTTNYQKMEFDTLRPCSKVLSILEFVKNENINLTIFPNPCSSLLNIHIDDYDYNSLHIGVYDINGRLLSENIIENRNDYSEDVSLLEDGIYFIRVHSEKGKFLGASKFIKQ